MFEHGIPAAVRQGAINRTATHQVRHKSFVKRIRVLQVGKYYYPFRGGMESSLYTLVNSLKDEVDFQVLVSNTKVVTEIGFVDGVKVIRMARWGSFFSQPLNPGLFFWLKTLKADIIHLHLPNPLAALFYLLANPCSRLIVSYHSDILRQNIFRLLYQPFLNRLLSRAEAIVATSQNLLDSSLLLGRFRAKCWIIPHGIDLDRFKITPELERRAGEIKARINLPIVLFVGRLVYYKGLEYLIRAMKDMEARLVVVGKGPLGFSLRALSRILGVKDKISWPGEVPDEELKAYYLASEMLVLPSCQNSEAFGLVILEAQAFARPVISARLPTGVSFINRHQETGLVVPARDAGALREAIRTLLDSKELRSEYGWNGRKRVEQEFTSRIMAGKFLTLYQAISNQTVL